MLNVIWKFPLPVDSGPFKLEMPKRAVILSVKKQNGRPHMWALVDPDLITEPREFYLGYTGIPFDGYKGLEFIGIVVSDGTPLVFHYFERRKK